MEIVPFDGWAVAMIINGKAYPQIDTVRYLRRESIEAATKPFRAYDDRGVMIFNSPQYRSTKTIWKELKGRGWKAVKVRMAGSE